MVALASATQIKHATAVSVSPAFHDKKWTSRIEAQGPWNPEKDPLPLTGASSLPMPVRIASREDIEPFFSHLKANGTHEQKTPSNIKETENSPSSSGSPRIESEEHSVPMLEFKKGVLYSDQRMDLCKMVVGPIIYRVSSTASTPIRSSSISFSETILSGHLGLSELLASSMNVQTGWKHGILPVTALIASPSQHW